MPSELPPDLRAEPGSYRDPDARVVRRAGRVLRLLDEKGAGDWDALRRTALFERTQASGEVVRTWPLPASQWPAGLGADVAGVLEHEVLRQLPPPPEWTFGMLRQAALLQLDLLAEAGEEGLTLKDGSAANVTFVGHRPVFVDVGSFERHRAEPWPGHRQWCATMLNPLLLEAHLGLPCQSSLRTLEGIAPAVAARLLRGRHRLHRGVLTHVALHARAERRLAGQASPSRFVATPVEVTVALAQRLRRVVEGLEPRRRESGWATYAPRSHYEPGELETKDRFVAEAVGRAERTQVLDLGTNDGRYARIAAEVAPVVAVDSDAVTVDRLHHSLCEQPPPHPITPLVVDLLDPTPPAGWDLAERPGFWDRQQPDLVLALALVHHLCLTGNVPPAAVVERLATLGAEVVLEVPHPEDPMVRRLLERKRPGQHADYRLDVFEALVSQRFTTVQHQDLRTRTLLHLVPR